MAKPMQGTKRDNRRFTVEEIDNGWLLKMAEMGSDKLLGRYCFTVVDDLFTFLKEELESDD